MKYCCETCNTFRLLTVTCNSTILGEHTVAFPLQHLLRETAALTLDTSTAHSFSVSDHVVLKRMNREQQNGKNVGGRICVLFIRHCLVICLKGLKTTKTPQTKWTVSELEFETRTKYSLCIGYYLNQTG